VVYKYNITVNGEKFPVEGSSQLSVISRACRDYIKAKGSLFNEKLTLTIVSEKVSGKVEPEVKEVETEVDLKKAQELVDKSTVVLREPKVEAKK